MKVANSACLAEMNGSKQINASHITHPFGLSQMLYFWLAMQKLHNAERHKNQEKL